MRCLFLAVAMMSVAAIAQPAAAQTAEEQRQLDWALERGRLIFALDRAAWVATDDLREHVPAADMSNLRGYIVDRDAQGFVAIFFAQEGDRLVTLYRGRVGANGIASREIFRRGQRPELTPLQLRLARVRGQLAAARPSLAMCNNGNPNFAIIPPAQPDGPIVLTPQTDNAAVPLGGHHRLTIDQAGQITNQRRFTNSCLSLPISTGAQGATAALTVTHLLDPIPTEIHVFTSMAARLPIFVGANNSLWEVTGEHIRFVSRIGAER